MINIWMAIEAIEDENERELIGKLYLQYSKKIKGLAYKIMLNQKDAEDALGNTFLRVIKYRKNFIGIDRDETKRLIVIYTRSACFDMLDKRDKLDIISTSLVFEDGEGSEYTNDLPDGVDVLQDFIRKETLQRVIDEIQTLKTPAKEIVLLKYYYNTRNTVIADLLGINVSTVGTIIQRSIAKIRAEMGEYSYDSE